MKLYRPYVTDFENTLLPDASGSLDIGSLSLAFSNGYIDVVHLKSDPTTPLQAATKQYVDNAVSGENLWDRSGTDLTPVNSGDNIILTGALKIDNDNEKITLGAGAQDFYAYFDGTQGVIETSDSDLLISSVGGNLKFQSEGNITFNTNLVMNSGMSLNSKFVNDIQQGSTDNLALTTKGYVDDAIAVENLWDRSGTDLSPKNAGDTVSLDGNLNVTLAAGNDTAIAYFESYPDAGYPNGIEAYVYGGGTSNPVGIYLYTMKDTGLDVPPP